MKNGLSSKSSTIDYCPAYKDGFTSHHTYWCSCSDFTTSQHFSCVSVWGNRWLLLCNWDTVSSFIMLALSSEGYCIHCRIITKKKQQWTVKTTRGYCLITFHRSCRSHTHTHFRAGTGAQNITWGNYLQELDCLREHSNSLQIPSLLAGYVTNSNFTGQDMQEDQGVGRATCLRYTKHSHTLV